MCDDGNPATTNDQCYHGACGAWMDIDTTIVSEQERLQWVAADDWIEGQGCTECEQQYPMYLALDVDQQRRREGETVGGTTLGHGAGSIENGVYSFMRWKHPELYFTDWKVDQSDSMGDMRGRALFVSKVGSCASAGQFNRYQCSAHQCGANGQGCTAADNHLEVRSENQFEVTGYSRMQVFVPTPTVRVSNVRTHSTRSYVAEPINVQQPYCE